MSNTKLTAHQNQQITETICRMAATFPWDNCSKDADADGLRAARRALVQECEEVNLATDLASLASLRMPR